MAQQRRERTIPNPVALPGTALVHEAACTRRDAESGDVMVIENTQVGGIGTDRHIVRRSVAEARDPATTPRADLCSHPCVTVTPTTASSRRCRSCAAQPCAACPWSQGGVVGMESRGDLAWEHDPVAARGVARPPRHHLWQACTRDLP